MKTKHRKQARAKSQRRWSHDIGAGTFAKLLTRNDNKALGGGEALDLQLKAVTALENIKRGADAKNAWRTLADMVNILTAFNEATDVAIEPFDDVRAAESGLVRAQTRYQQTGKMALDGLAIAALEVCLDIHETALRHVTIGAWIKAMEYVEGFIRHAAKANPEKVITV